MLHPMLRGGDSSPTGLKKLEQLCESGETEKTNSTSKSRGLQGDCKSQESERACESERPGMGLYSWGCNTRQVEPGQPRKPGVRDQCC